MERYILSGDLYQAISGIVKESKYLNSCYEPTKNKLEAVFNLVRIESKTPIKKLIVPLSSMLKEGDKIWVYFENYSYDPEWKFLDDAKVDSDGKVSLPHDLDSYSESIERKLDPVEIPDMIKIVEGRKVVKVYDLFS